MSGSSSLGDQPTREQILNQRERILASKLFSLSKRQSRFLEYVTNEALDGRGGKIKEFNIGIEVFARDESFDPRVDSIVRVEAGRLRGKLREYYDDEGHDDPLRIDLPKGGYAPVFRLVEPPATPSPVVPTLSPSNQQRPNRYLKVVATLGLVLVLGVVAFLSTSPEEDHLTSSTPKSSYSIAVLPLRDWSQGSETSYFSDGMTDSLITNLARNPALKVTSLTSVMSYKNVNRPIPEIARELNVSHIIEGSVQRVGDRVRITTQLIDGMTDKHVWTQSYERSFTDMLTVQKEVAAKVAAALAGEISPDDPPLLEEVSINPAAYEAYLKGRYFRNQLTADGFRKGIEYFRQAIELQPDYAEAYAGLASCQCLLGGHGFEMVSPNTGFPEAKRNAEKAISLNDQLAEPIAFLSILRFKFDWDWQGAETFIEKAITLNPSFFEAYVWHSQMLEAKGRYAEAVEQARYARSLSPLSRAANLNLGWQLYQAGSYLEAEAQFDGIIEFNPEFWGGHWGKGHYYREQRQYDQALTEFRQAVALEGGHSLPMASLGYTYGVAGMRKEALQVVEDLKRLSMQTYVSPFHVAIVYVGLDETDLAFEWLEKAYLVHARSMAWLNATKEMSVLHADPRFKDLTERIGLPAV